MKILKHFTRRLDFVTVSVNKREPSCKMIYVVVIVMSSLVFLSTAEPPETHTSNI